MASVLDVAAYVLEKRGPMSAMKLQKLVYYGQAWHLVAQGCPLFRDEIQAWAYGPIAPALYARHRKQFVVSIADLQAFVSGAPLAETARQLLDKVIEVYGIRDGSQLSSMTHAEDPWRNARAGAADRAPSQATISIDAMKQYYEQQPPPW